MQQVHGREFQHNRTEKQECKRVEMQGKRMIHWMYLCGVALAATLAIGCGSGSSGGGTQPPPPPPPKTITLTNTAPYNTGSNSILGGINWVVAGVNGFTLLANGTGFTSASVIEWNGTALSTQFGSSINLAATVSSALVATPGTASIKVYDSSLSITSNALTFSIASTAAATAGVVQMITVAPDGTPANGNVYVKSSISATGRYVAFQSDATNLGAGVAGSWAQIYERDTCIGAPSGCVPTTIPISVTYDGSAPNQNSRTSSISGDGRYIAYDTSASNILAVDDPICSTQECVFLRDTCIGAPTGCTPSTTLISIDTNGNQANGANPDLSPDGRYLTYASSTANVAENNPANIVNIFLHDTCNGASAGCTSQTILNSQSSNGVIGNERSDPSVVNTGGRYVAFQSFSTNLIPNDTDGWSDIFVRDTCIGAPSGCTPNTTIESLSLNGAYGNDGLDGEVVPSISSDGRYVAFASDSTNMVTQDVTIGAIYERDTCIGAAAGCVPTTSLVTIGNDGSLPDGGTNNQSMSADGRFIAFASLSNNLVPGDTFAVNAWKDIFVRDTCIGAPTGCTPNTVRVSVPNYPNYFGAQANDISDYPQISGDGHYVIFMSGATNLLSTGSNGNEMVYLAKTGY